MRTLLLRYISVIVFIIAVSGCSSTPKIKRVETSMLEMNSASVVPIDSSFIKTVLPYKSRMDSIMSEILGSSDQALLKGLPQGSLGNFVADAVLKKANDHYQPADNIPADICLLNNGGLRSQLPKGNITLGNVYELMPFENNIVILTISGEKTKLLFESLVEYNGAPFAGATIKAKGKKISALKINGKNFDVTKSYKIVTSDYLAGGGDKYNFFNVPEKTEYLNYLLRDAIVDHIKDESKKGNIIKAQIDGRISYE